MTKKWFKIGIVGVDSGQLMITDPCYLDKYWKKEGKKLTFKKPNEYSYDGCCTATLSKEGHGQLNYQLGHAGIGVAFCSGYGDGSYGVWGRKNKEGRIVEVRILMG